MLDYSLQAVACLFGCASVWLLSLKNPRAIRWGWIASAVAQPFFLAVYIRSEQWGFVVVWCWYTGAIWQAIQNYWLRKQHGNDDEDNAAVD